MSEILLDEATHIYNVDGHIIPSVTQILFAMGLIKSYTNNPWYAERGIAIHRACHLMDIDDLDESTLDPQLRGYIDAYRKFKEESAWKFEHLEESLCHPAYRYCGTPDRWLPLIDIKSTENHEPLQLEAYAELLRANGFNPLIHAYFLTLYEDGKYKLDPYKLDRTRLGVFLSATIVYHERKERGLL